MIILLSLYEGRPIGWLTGSTPADMLARLPFDAPELYRLVDAHPVWTPGVHHLGAWQGREVWLLIEAESQTPSP
jgi:hypothetical protein